MQQLKCDVLVIGAGLAGCWAGIRAREMANSVIVVDIGKVSRSGKSSFSGAGILCPDESDDLDVWQREMVEKGEYLNNQDWVRLVLEEQPQRLRDMGQWGLRFERDAQGHIFRHVGLNHVDTRITTVDSLEMMEVMRKRLEGMGVSFLERVMITDLLTSDGAAPTGGAVVGAMGFHTRTGETFVINAGATVMASGNTRLFGTAGEGIVQAFRVGAEITGMEFSRCLDEMHFDEKYLGVGVHLNTFQRLGMKLVNAAGERFMEKYPAMLMERGRREDLALAITLEGLQGNAPLYIDLRHLDKENMDKLHTLPTTAWIVGAMEEQGIDFSRQLIKYGVASGPILVSVGGIRNNTYGESNVPGLYAAGEVSGYPAHGTYSVGGVNLASCCVGGYRAGEYAAKYAGENGLKPVVPAQAQQLVRKALRPVKARAGLRPEDLFDEIHSYLSPARRSIFRDARGIRDVLEHTKDWEIKSRTLKVLDYHGLVKANRVASYVQCARLVFRSSLMREETRSNNIRTDYPYRDNVNWLQWIVQVSDGKGGASIRKVPVPLYRYPVKPKEYMRIPTSLPLPH